MRGAARGGAHLVDQSRGLGPVRETPASQSAPITSAATKPAPRVRRSATRVHACLMRALTWHANRDVRVDTVPDPTIERPTDAIIRVTSSGICGSDLHLYEVLGPFIDEGDVLGHEPMGIVEEVGAEVTHIAPGDRVVIPFNISCGRCYMCDKGLQSQCETTQVHEQDTGAALFGYTKLYGQVPGGQAEYLRVPQAQYGPIKVPEGAGRRPLRLPLRCTAHRVAGRRIRQRPSRRDGARARPWPDRRDVHPDRAAPRRGTGPGDRPRARASAARACSWCRGAGGAARALHAHPPPAPS
ncbi:MAG: hypothetical protein QOD83_4001 [Solirubrobacteraceae bacterium]|nr:hypothetical protein [Solirubrobacteraceae bacterium]